jgi:uncharacterized protein YbaR (Trm112 family)
MPHVREQVLVCPTCGRTRELPECHGKSMEHDSGVFFCPSCAKELAVPQCCSVPMRLRAKLRDIRRELFQKL